MSRPLRWMPTRSGTCSRSCARCVTRAWPSIFVSHFLDQIYEITDRLTILRNGQFIKEVMTKDTPRDELIGMMIGKSAAELSQIGAKKARREITPGEKRSSMSRASARRHHQPG